MTTLARFAPFVAVSPTEGALRRLEEAAGDAQVARIEGFGADGAGTGADAVIFELADGAPGPIALTTAARAHAPFAQIVFLGPAGAVARVRQQLLLVGGLSDQWSFLKAEHPEDWAPILIEARERAQRRRALGGTRGALSAPTAALQPVPAEASPLQTASVLAHMREAVCCLDLRGGITYVNPAAGALYGQPLEALIGARLADRVAPGDREAFERLLAEVAAGGAGGTVTQAHRTAAGQPLSVEVSVSPVKDWRGQLAGITVLVRDVGDRLAHEAAIARHNEELQAVNEELAAQAEELAQQQEEVQRAYEALAQHQQILASLLEHLPASVGYADRELVVRLVNAQFASDYQRPAEAFIGKTFHDAFPEDRFPGLARQAEAPLHQVLETRQPWRNSGYPVLIPGADGRLQQRFRDAVVVPVFDAAGAIEGLLSLAFDTTDRVLAEREAERSAAALRAQVALTERIIQHAPLVMAYLDQDLIYRWNNPLHSQLIGKPPSEVVGRPLSAVLPPDFYRRTEHLYREVLATGEPHHARAFPARFAGRPEVVHLDFSYVPVFDEDARAQGLLVIASDVSDRVERERLQASTIETLRQADRAKDEFLSVISHELRTPLNFITGFASTLEDEVQGPLNEAQRQAIEKILAGSERMLLLVDDLLDFARMQAGTFRLEPAPTPYTPVVEEVAATMRQLAGRKQLALHVEIAGDHRPTIDAHRVAQVLTNLVSNAIKFTDRGAVTVRVYPRGEALVTEVSDTGDGIAAADQPKLFRRFQQLDMSATRKAGGTGLGLAISKAIVEAHGGAIGVESAPGSGATFWFTLPLSP